MGFLKNLLSNGLLRAKALKWLRWASNSAGTSTMTLVAVYIHRHFGQLVNDTDGFAIATVLGTAVGGLIMSVGSAFFAQADANNVDAKMQIAAVTGSIAAANDKSNVQAVKQAVTAPSGSPEALQQVMTALKGNAE